MNFEDFIISPRNFRTENWQIGAGITKEIKEDSSFFLFRLQRRKWGCRSSGFYRDQE
jgi:hypothetical protein